jgi:predicted ATPase
LRLIKLGIGDRVVQFHESTGFGTNQVHILTGSNGSGKSAALEGLADYFGREIKFKSPDLQWTVAGRTFDPRDNRAVGVSRTIVQTYSPYTRFFPSAEPEGSVVDIYSIGQLIESPYVCVGLSRSARLTGASLSRRVLEQALERVSSSALNAWFTSDFFNEAGFGGVLHMRYGPLQPMKEILRSDDARHEVERQVELAVQGVGVTKKVNSRFVKEARQSDKGMLVELIITALDQVEQLVWYPEGCLFSFNFFQKQSYDFSIFQSLTLLKKLGFLKLRECRLSSNNEYGGIDISTASSGQQQIICSVLSLVATLADDSLVLIDEPELSLHPKWQQLYFKLLSSTLKPFNNCQVVIATHSPLLVQSGINHGASIIKLDAGTTEVDRNAKDISVESALIDIFETPVEDSMQLASMVFDAVSKGESARPAEKKRYLERLFELKKIYARLNGGEVGDRNIINTAIDVLEMD